MFDEDAVNCCDRAVMVMIYRTPIGLIRTLVASGFRPLSKSVFGCLSSTRLRPKIRQCGLSRQSRFARRLSAEELRLIYDTNLIERNVLDGAVGFLLVRCAAALRDITTTTSVAALENHLGGL